MRSRYTAFSRGDTAYVLRTWHSSTRPTGLGDLGRWVRLEVLETRAGGLFDAEGVVRFRAHAVDGVLEETSRFAREGGEWRYVDGDVRS